MTPQPKAETRTPPHAFYLFAFLSGVAALVYQVTWTKLLSFTFGSTTVATSAVVAGFMGGMGLGAWAFHRAAARWRQGIAVYATLEVAIAISAACLTAGFATLPILFATIARSIGPGPTLDFVQIFAVVLVLLVPSALMGATYPALCMVLIRSRSDADAHLGRIYGLNTLGAACGALLAGFVLVEHLGLRGSALLANAINLSVGLGAVVVGRRAKRTLDLQRHSPAAAVDLGVPGSSVPFWMSGAILVGSGFTTLGYEILWLQGLRYLFGNSVYALTAMLFVFLLGLGIGALFLPSVLRLRRPGLALGRIQISIALLSVVAIAGEALVLGTPGISDWLTDRARSMPWWERVAMQSAVASILLLPATVMMGLSYPLAARLFLTRSTRLGERVGLSYLLSHVGGVAGATLTALVILPGAGVIGGTQILAATNLALGVAVLTGLGWQTWGRRLLVYAVSLGGLVLLLPLLPERLPFQGEIGETPQLVWEREAVVGTVQVRTDPVDSRRWSMSIDGTIIGVNGPWHPMYTKQQLLAHIPMALDPRISRTLNVGLATGSTLSALTAYPQVRTLDVVEINEAVVEGSRFFPSASALNDPRSRVVTEDVLQFLLRGREPYDLIVSDGKLNHGHAGNAKLLSRDFYRACASRLDEDGMLIQWVPTGMLAESYEVVLRTFADFFPEVEIFFSPSLSSYLVGSRTPIRGRLAPGESSSPARVQRAIESLELDGVEGLLALWVADRRGLLEVLPNGPINTWDHSLLEFAIHKAPKDSNRHSSRDNLALLVAAGDRALRSQAIFPGTTAARSEIASLVRDAHLLGFDGHLWDARRLLLRAFSIDSSDRAAREALRHFGGQLPAVGAGPPALAPPTLRQGRS